MPGETTDILHKVGVVVLHYNQAACCLDCIHSILNNENYPGFEVVVVDNASPRLEMREMLRAELPGSVFFIQNPTNTGYAAGNNVGARFLIEERNVEFVFVLNSDTIVTKPIIGKMVEALSVDSIAAVSPAILNEHHSNAWRMQTQVRRLPGIFKLMVVNSTFASRLPVCRSWTNDYLYRDKMPWQDQTYVTDTINGAAFIVKAAVLRQIGYLDERTFLYYEELILGCQLQRLGLHCAFVGGAQVVHWQGLSTGARLLQFPLPMYRYSLNSFALLGTAYYGQSEVVMHLYKAYRWVEYYLKKMLVWLSGKS